MESRENKFKKYREQITYELEKPTDELEVPLQEEVQTQEENHRKKNTLTMSIDQIIEAHDEYTMIIEKKQLENRIKQEKKDKRIAKLKKILRYVGIGIILLLIVAVLVIIILAIWK